MPELPDIVIYAEALDKRIGGRVLRAVRLAHPFLLRTADPPVDVAVGRTVTSLRRIGKRIAIGLDGDLWFLLHLMIAGRLHWRELTSPIKRRRELATFDFNNGSLVLTEAGTRKRASLYVIEGEQALANQDPGGLEVLDAGEEDFARALKKRNHTLKRALTDPRIFSGIGNAYSDEILHRARLLPVTLTQKLDRATVGRLYMATRDTLLYWIERLRTEVGDGFPEKVTAFREGMAVHGRYGKPCPVCESPVQRIRYATNETNYCACCQTGGRVLADRSLSRLLKKDWPRTLEELEELRGIPRSDP